jgi:Tfp pilus assembly protein PilF
MKTFKKALAWLMTFLVLGLFIYLYFTGTIQKKYSHYLSKIAEEKMKNQDYLAAVGYYEKVLDVDSTDAKGHLDMAIALDSLKRPVEAGWHYKDAIRYREMNKRQ